MGILYNSHSLNAKPYNYNVDRITIYETITLSDSLVKNIAKPLSETINLTESINKNVSKPLSDSLTLSDSLVKNIAKSIADNITVNDSFYKNVSKNVGDTVTLGESISKNVVKPLDDNLSLSDSFVKNVTKNIAQTVYLQSTLELMPSISVWTTTDDPTNDSTEETQKTETSTPINSIGFAFNSKRYNHYNFTWNKDNWTEDYKV